MTILLCLLLAFLAGALTATWAWSFLALARATSTKAVER